MPPLAAVQPPPQMSASYMQAQSRGPLRRAVYIHVSDLTSAYNIDHLKLEQELARVLADRNAAANPTTPDEGPPLNPRPSSSTTDTEGSLISIPQKRLQPPRGGYNLCLLVGKVNVVVDKMRVDGSRVRLAEVEVGDETGTVSLRARDDQIDVLQEVSERSGAVVLRNCTLELYQGRHIRLAVTKWGKLSTYPDKVASTPPPPSKMNQDRNYSLIDLSLVASEMVEQPASESGFIHARQKTPERDSERQSSSRPTSRQQQFQSSHLSRKGGRERKQLRQQKPSGAQLPMGYQEAGAGPMTGFPGMHAFPSGYSDSAMEVPHYSYSSPTHRPQEGPSIPQPSAQHLLLQQQYELQQRQMQQMQMYQEQERRRILSSQQQRHQMQASSVLLPGVVSSGSFDPSGDYPVSSVAGPSDQHPSVVPVVGSSPLLIPMSVTASSSLATHAPGSSIGSFGKNQPETYGDVVAGNRGRRSGQPQRGLASAPSDPGTFTHPDTDKPPDTAWHGDSFSPRVESPVSPGRMNPQATAFAPSYMPSQGSQQHTLQSPAYTYVAYDPSQQGPGTMYGSPTSPHPSMYAQGVLYVPAVHAVGGTGQSTLMSEQTQEGTSGREFQPIEGPDTSSGSAHERGKQKHRDTPSD